MTRRWKEDMLLGELTSSLLSSERTSLGQTSLSTCRLAEDSRAAGANNDGLCVREDGGDCEAAGALDIHEEGAGSWNEVLEGFASVCKILLESEGSAVRRVGNRTLSLCLRASAAGVGLRRSSARTYPGITTLAFATSKFHPPSPISISIC